MVELEASGKSFLGKKANLFMKSQRAERIRVSRAVLISLIAKHEDPPDGEKPVPLHVEEYACCVFSRILRVVFVFKVAKEAGSTVYTQPLRRKWDAHAYRWRVPGEPCQPWAIDKIAKPRGEYMWR